MHILITLTQCILNQTIHWRIIIYSINGNKKINYVKTHGISFFINHITVHNNQRCTVTHAVHKNCISRTVRSCHTSPTMQPVHDISAIRQSLH